MQRSPAWRVLVAVVLTALAEPASARSLIDTHVHQAFWAAGLKYSYPNKFPGLAGRNWTLADYRAALPAGLSVGAILMELDKLGDPWSQALDEAARLQRVADDGPVQVAGLISSAPVSWGRDAMAKFVPEIQRVAPRLVGIREAVWHRPDAAWVANGSYYAGLEPVAAQGLALDLLVTEQQLAGVAQLAAALPGLRINVNHLAYPNVSAREYDKSWEAAMARLAQHENVYVKLSGLPQAFGQKAGWDAASFAPYVATAVRLFGARRVNFAGNWFVLTEFGSFKRMLAAVDAALQRARLSPAELDQIFSGTARRLYKLV